MTTSNEYIVSRPLDLQGIIQTIRKEAEISQNEVATRLGIRSGSYSEYERNLLQGSLSRFLKLIKALDGELILRIGGSPEMPKSDLRDVSQP